MKLLATLFVSCLVLFAQGDNAELDALERQMVAFYASDSYTEAIEVALKAVALAERIHLSDHLETAAWLNNLAFLYEKLGQHAKAEPLYTRALTISERVLGPDNPYTATALNNLAALYKSQGQYAKAEPLYSRALTIFERVLGPDHPDTAESLNSLGSLYKSQGQYARAEPLYTRALAVREKVLGPDHPDTAQSLNNLATLYVAQEQDARAEPLYTRALAIREKTLGPNHPDVATVLDNLGALYDNQGQYAKAEPLFARALAIREEVLGPDHPDTAESLDYLGALYDYQGQYARAEPLFTRALTIFEKVLGPDHPDTATSLNCLAGLYHHQGQYARAELLYGRALAIREKVLGPDHPDTATSLNNLAYVYDDEGQYTKAEPLYSRAVAMSEKVPGPDHSDTALSLNNLALFYERQGQYAKAEPLYSRALAIMERVRGPDHSDTATSVDNLAGLYHHQGQYATAELLYGRALAIREKVLGPDHPNTAKSVNNLAGLYHHQGQYDRAELLYGRALAIMERVHGPDHPDTATTLSNLAHVYDLERQYAKAEPLYTRALAIDEKMLGPDHPLTARQTDHLTFLFAQGGRVVRARELLLSNWPNRISWLDDALRSGRESFRRSWISDLQNQLSLLIALQVGSAPLRAVGLEAVLKTKNRISEELSVSLTFLRGHVDDESGRQLDSLQDVWQQQRHLELTLRRQAKTTTELSDVWQKQGHLELTNPADANGRKDLKEKEDSLIAAISARNAEFRELTKTPSLRDVRSRLGEAALVEMVQFDEVYLPERNKKRIGSAHYGAYLLRATGEIGWLDLGPTDAINKLIRRYRFAVINTGNEAVARKAAQDLERLVFEPVRQALPGVQELYIAPDGLLHLVPYAALPDDSGQPLLKSFMLHTLSTGRDLVLGDPLAPAQAPIISGIETFGEQKPERPKFPDLPGAQSEADAVTEIIPAGQHVAADRVNRNFLLERINAPRILHLATHGFYFPDEPGNDTDPLTRSGIALNKANESDEGILTAKDATILRLRGTQLVVLSACETGVGEATFSDGVVGLQRSLKLAGARSEILTLWSVSDEKTRDLMVLFYRNLFEKKLTKSEALRQAQIAIADQGIDPYYWAPFVLYGDGGPLR
jgi:tetratricopeptide (TPR) repeat protein/CHAT domain-containing protein